LGHGRQPQIHPQAVRGGRAASSRGFEAVIKNAAAGDGVTDLVHKIKFWNKLDALEALAQHLGLVKNQIYRCTPYSLFWSA
jgi:hypothetical protein